MITPDTSSSDQPQSGTDPLSLLAQILPLIGSAAGYPVTGKCVGWIMGMIAGSDDDIGEQLADMDRKLDKISQQIAALEARFMKAVEQIIKEQRRIHWEQMVNDMKPHLARIETAYQRVQGLARLEDREEARRYVPELTKEILSATTGIEYALQVIHDLTTDALHANGFLSTWSIQVHDAAHTFWVKALAEADKTKTDYLAMHRKLSAKVNAQAESNFMAQTEAIFAYLVGVQLKGLILLIEAAHAETVVDSSRGQTLYDYFMERYQKLMQAQCDLFWRIVEELTSQLEYFALICWGTEAAAEGYTALTRADRLVGAALGLDSLLVVRCNIFPQQFKHPTLQPGYKYLASADNPPLLLMDGSRQITSDASIYNPAAPYHYLDGKLSLNNPVRRWVFENLESAVYYFDPINNQNAPVLKIDGTTMAWGRGKYLINPDLSKIPLTIEQPSEAHLDADADSSRYYRTLNLRAYMPSKITFGPSEIKGKDLTFFDEALVIEENRMYNTAE
ncbi:MAG: hypothetical protein WAM60_16375 [Candidatus Promineifilaceae bacterium]